MTILRKSYVFNSWKGWDHQINFSVLDFCNAFSILPNILRANSVTFARMDIIADKDKVKGPEEKSIGKYETVSISGFIGKHYELAFFLDTKLPDKSFSLLYDSDPDDGGVPIPEEDTKVDFVRQSVLES